MQIELDEREMGAYILRHPDTGNLEAPSAEREAAGSSGKGGAGQAEGSAETESRFSRSFKRHSGECGAGKKISPGGELREERARMGRGRDACCGRMRRWQLPAEAGG